MKIGEGDVYLQGYYEPTEGFSDEEEDESEEDEEEALESK